MSTFMFRFLTALCLVAALFLFDVEQSTAQNTANCDQEMTQANDLYALGRFDEAISFIQQCLDKSGISEDQRRSAYRIIGLSYIGKGLEGDAKDSVRRLLALAPNYTPDPVLDPPDFVSLVNELKAEMQGSAPNQPVAEQRVIQSSEVGPDREGFTLLLSLGVGFQSLESDLTDESATGLGGLNIGLGGFIGKRTAIMARISGTNATYEVDGGGEFSVLSGTGALTIQYWVSDNFFIEGGPGLGFGEISADTALGSVSENETGFGIHVGGGFVVFNKGRNNIHIGVEYAPAFLDGIDINNIGVTVGYQLL